MLRIFRKNKKKPGAVQDVQLRPAEQSGQDPLEHAWRIPAANWANGWVPATEPQFDRRRSAG